MAEADGSSRAGVRGPHGRDLGTGSARPGRSRAQVGTPVPSRAPRSLLRSRRGSHVPSVPDPKAPVETGPGTPGRPRRLPGFSSLIAHAQTPPLPGQAWSLSLRRPGSPPTFPTPRVVAPRRAPSLRPRSRAPTHRTRRRTGLPHSSPHTSPTWRSWGPSSLRGPQPEPSRRRPALSARPLPGRLRKARSPAPSSRTRRAGAGLEPSWDPPRGRPRPHRPRTAPVSARPRPPRPEQAPRAHPDGAW